MSMETGHARRKDWPELPIWAGRTVHPPEFGRNRGDYTNGEGQWDEVFSPVSRWCGGVRLARFQQQRLRPDHREVVTRRRCFFVSLWGSWHVENQRGHRYR